MEGCSTKQVDLHDVRDSEEHIYICSMYARMKNSYRGPRSKCSLHTIKIHGPLYVSIELHSVLCIGLLLRQGVSTHLQ